MVKLCSTFFLSLFYLFTFLVRNAVELCHKLLVVRIRNTQITVRKLSICWLFRNLDDVAFSFASFFVFVFAFFKRKMSINQKHGKMGDGGIRKLRKMRRKWEVVSQNVAFMMLIKNTPKLFFLVQGIDTYWFGWCSWSLTQGLSCSSNQNR